VPRTVRRTIARGVDGYATSLFFSLSPIEGRIYIFGRRDSIEHKPPPLFRIPTLLLLL